MNVPHPVPPPSETENPEGDAGAEDPGEDGGEGNVQPDAAGE